MAEAEREAVLKSGIVAKRFMLGDRVIAGNFASTVLLASARSDAAPAAVKVLMKSNFASEQERKSAMMEVAIHSAMLPHANVLGLLAAEETPDAILLVTPFMADGDLWSLMQYGQTFLEVQVRNCMAQMLAAAAHVHDVCGLIHADIKPQNFLLARKDGRFAIQLCDFGFSERPGPEGYVAFYVVRGTSGWLAPEMLRHSDYSFSLDLFPLGLIAFRMLGGYAPFDPPSRFQPKVDYDDRCWCHIGDVCRDFISKLLCLEPSGRGTAAEASEHPWIQGPEPEPPTQQQLDALAAYGPPPDSTAVFWPAESVPKPCSCAGESTVVRSRCGSSDDDYSSDFNETLPPLSPT